MEGECSIYRNFRSFGVKISNVDEIGGRGEILDIKNMDMLNINFATAPESCALLEPPVPNIAMWTSWVWGTYEPLPQ